MSSYGGRLCSLGVSVEHLLRFSRRFSSAVNSMLILGGPEIYQDELALISMVYCRIKTIHDKIVQLTTRSLQLSKEVATHSQLP